MTKTAPPSSSRLQNSTVVASLQLSLIALEKVLAFNPGKHKFNIAKINTELSALFVLATASHRALGQDERIQHTLKVYRTSASSNLRH